MKWQPDHVTHYLAPGERVTVSAPGITRAWECRCNDEAPPRDRWRLPFGDEDYPPAMWYAAQRHNPPAHAGIDWNLDVAPWGDVERRLGLAVYAAADGVVTYVTDDWGGVGAVVVKHQHDGRSLWMRYAHITPTVRAGQRVRAGDALGSFADWRTGDHLHNDCAFGSFAREYLDSSVDFVDPVGVYRAHLSRDVVDAALRKGDPPPPAPAPPAADPLIGFNDYPVGGAAGWMRDEGLRGLIVQPLALYTQQRPLDYTDYPGLAVVLRLNYSWASADGFDGTFPAPGSPHWRQFVAAAADTIINSSGVYGYVIGNEHNNPREWPDSATLSPRDIADVCNAVHQRVVDAGVSGARIAPGAVDPFTVASGITPDAWLRQVYDGLDFEPGLIDVHGYVRGPDPALVGSDETFGDAPLEWMPRNYPGCIEALLERSGVARRYPVIVSEFNHLWLEHNDESRPGWVDDERAADVVRAAYEAARAHGYAGLALYRWTGDAWALHQRHAVLQAVKELAK